MSDVALALGTTLAKAVMFHGFVKRWLVLAPLVFALASFGWGLVQRHLASAAAEALATEARALGIELRYDDLRIGLLGVVQLDGVRITSPELGTVPIARVEARVDLISVLAGAPRLSRVAIWSPRLRLTEAELGPLCQKLDLCPRTPPSRLVRREVARGSELARSRPAPSPRPAVAAARPPRFGTIAIRDLRLEVLSDEPLADPWLALYDLDLTVRAGVDRVRVSGEGHLVSVYTNTPSVPITFRGDVGADDLGLVVDVPGGLAINAPGATVSFEQVGLHLGALSDVWLSEVVVLPDLIDFTDAWRAESISAVVSMRSAPVPERVIVEGLKGELDLLALSDFAQWLAEPDSGGAGDGQGGAGQELAELRRSLVDGLSAVRSGLYGEVFVVEAGDGDVELRYPDGTTLALQELSLAVGPGAHGQDTARVDFRGTGEVSDLVPKTQRGHVEVLLRQLTAAGIATWVE